MSLFINSRRTNFFLWHHGLKPIILDKNIRNIEKQFRESDCFTSDLYCKTCRIGLSWHPTEDDTDTDRTNIIANMTCIFCNRKFLQCDTEETIKILIKLTENESPQIIASALNSIIIGYYQFNCLTGMPFVPDNPMETLLKMYEESPNLFKFGGPNAVIVADLYEGYNSHPILYIADTVTIPTRYYLYAVKMFGEKQMCDSEDFSGELIKEFQSVIKRVIRPNSKIILGEQLQEIIPEEIYGEFDNGSNLIVLPLHKLKQLDMKNSNSNKTSDIAKSFTATVKKARVICRIISNMVRTTYKFKSEEERYDALQRYLTAAIWIRTFNSTPFESFLYHITN